MATDTLIDQFAGHLAGEGLAARTIKDYVWCVGHFVRWLTARGGALTALERRHLVEYQAALAARPGRKGKVLSAQARLHAMLALVKLSRFLAATGRVPRDPSEGLVLPRVVRRPPDNVLSVRQMEQLLSVPRIDEPVDLRNRALMELLYATGLRQSEALDLALDDVDLAAGEVRVVRGKGGRGRVVPIGLTVASVLAAYLAEARPALTRDGDDGHFFVSRRGRRVDPSRLLKTFKRYAAQVGIRRPVGFHTFRHSVATHLLQRGVGIRHIQELLGHGSLASTQIYTKVAISDLKRMHARYHPREAMDL